MPVYTGKATDFVNFSRGSLATVTDSDGKIKWAPHNLLIASEQLNNTSYWSIVGSGSVTSNSTLAPNNTLTAETLTFSGAGTDVQIRYTSPQSVLTRYTFGVFAKAGTANWLRLRNIAFHNSLDQSVYFNLSNGAVGTVGAGVTSYTITSVGNGWYYCTVTGTTPATITNNLVDIALASSDGVYLPVQGSSIYIWGAHLYRSDLGGMQSNGSAYPMYNPTTPKNLLGYTENFSNAAWTKNSATVSTDAIISPNGMLNADKIVANLASSIHAINSTNSSLSSPWTVSVYAKAGEYDRLIIWTSTTFYSSFNLKIGVVENTTLPTGITSQSITPVGNGWYLCVVQSTNTASGTYVAFAPFNAAYTAGGNNGAPSFIGDGTSGIYLWGAQLSDSASLDPYVANHFAAPTSAAYYGPRIDYDPVSLSAKGLLVEEQRVNGITNSGNFSAWNVPQNITISGSGIVAPDGTLTGYKIVENSASGQHWLGQITTFTITSGVTYTISVYAKQGERGYLQMLGDAGGSRLTAGAIFNLTNGTIYSTAVGASSSITPVGDGWYRCVVTATASSTSTAYPYFGMRQNSNIDQYSYTGDGVSGLYLWGPQFEAGAFATSYIPTAGSQVTRNTDVANFAISSIPWKNENGSVVVEATSNFIDDGGLNTVILCSAADSGIVNYCLSLSVSTLTTRTGQPVHGLRAGDASPAYTVNGGVSDISPGNFKVGGSFDVTAGKLRMAANGIAYGEASIASTTPTPTQFSLGGKNGGGGSGGSLYIKNISIIQRALTNTELQQRTL